MPKFRKKPVVIEAVRLRFEPTDAEIEEVQAFLADAEWESDRDGAILIHTLEGVMRADEGDWIIRGVQGELYPCKNEIFRATYEFVPETS